MGEVVFKEMSPRTLQILRFLDDHGARRSPGFQIHQDEFGEAIGINPRYLRSYTKLLEEHGVIHIRRTTTDGTFGKPRVPNIYTLLCSVEEYETTIGPALAEKRRERLSTKMRAIARNHHAENKRARRLAKRAESVAAVQAKIGPPIDEETLSTLSTAYDDVPDEELAGW